MIFLAPRCVPYCGVITQRWVTGSSRLIDQFGDCSLDGTFWRKTASTASVIQNIKEDRNNRVGILTNSNREFLSALFAILSSGASAVPLSHLHPLPQLEYFMTDSGMKAIVTDEHNHSLVHRLVTRNTSCKIVVGGQTFARSTSRVTHNNLRDLLNVQDPSTEGIILYTSGTTGRPKGVSLTVGNILTQIKVQSAAWEWSPEDVVLHTLPLYHTHGLINALLAPLYFGGTVVIKNRFIVEEVMRHFTGDVTTSKGPVTAFTGVPTMYSYLLDFMNKNCPGKVSMRNLRLLMSGSAPLSNTLSTEWTQRTDIVLLERYGCTETGMILTNPLKGRRYVGFVGMPFETVSVRLVDKTTAKVRLTADNSGVTKQSVENMGDLMSNDLELLVSGPSVFSHYINRPEETEKALSVDADGTSWYHTGDTVGYSAQFNSFKINGRTSVDILKSGGFKISALDVETKLLDHPSIKECAVVGIEDEKWGEIVGAYIQTKIQGEKVSTESLTSWCLYRMPRYWIPRKIVVTNEPLPRNNMGKVNKKELRNMILSM